MKKIFTLIGMTLAAMSVNAQEVIDVASSEVDALIQNSINNPVVLNSSYFISVPESEHIFPANTWNNGDGDPNSITGGSPIGLQNFTWEYSTENLTVKANSTLNADATNMAESWNLVKGENEDGTYKNTTLTTDECTPKFVNYVQPKTGNPSSAYKDFYEYGIQKDANDQDLYDSDGNPVEDQGRTIHRILEPVWAPGGDLPAKGCYYEFTAKKDGKVTIAIMLNKNLNSNKLYIVDESTKQALTNDQLTIKGFRQNYNYEKEKGSETTLAEFTLTDDYLLTHANMGTDTSRPFYGYVTFDAKANTTYMALSPKSQLGFFGCSFDDGTASGIKTVKAAEGDAPVYNLAGQRVNSSAKGLLIKNGRKYVK